MNDVPFKATSDSSTARKILADESHDLLENKAFTAAVLALRKVWFGELMTAVSKPVQDELVAKMKALEAIPQQLQIFINDEKMVQARKR